MVYTTRPVITGRKGVITSGHYLATQAGLKMYAFGGNAIDAGVAAGFALSVLKPQDNTLGGECPILIYSPNTKKVVSISGQGTSPGKATINWFKENEINAIPGDGFLGATVPGTFGAYCTALKYYGRLNLSDVLQPAIELAREGFPVYELLRDIIGQNEKKFREEWPTTAEVFLIGGKVPEAGQILKQVDLAMTLQKAADTAKKYEHEGRENAIEQAMNFFYKGEIADIVLEYVKNNPVKDATGRYNTALLEKEDFKNYSTIIEEPVSADYRNYRVFKCGTWTQGPVFLQQLKLLEGFNLKKMSQNSGDYIHLLIECSKLAFADRERYYGDPLFTEVPLARLLSKEYNDERRKLVRLDAANNGNLWDLKETDDEKAFRGDTTHLDAVDFEGFMISATPSGAWIPSSPVIPGAGFPLGTRAQVFNLIEGHPNSLQPGKRPRTTLTPSIAYKDGKPWMAFGTMGGDMQDQWSLQFFLNVVEFGMNIQKAIDAETFHTSHFPNSFYPHEVGRGLVSVEEGIDMKELYRLQTLGHKLKLLPKNNNGQVCAALTNHATGVLEGAASSKNDGQEYAMGW